MFWNDESCCILPNTSTFYYFLTAIHKTYLYAETVVFFYCLKILKYYSLILKLKVLKNINNNDATICVQQEIGQRRAQLEYEHSMLVRHHESTQDLEYKHLAALQKMKDEQLRKQHETERDNQKDYNLCAEADLRKKHALEVKQQPRSLRVSNFTLVVEKSCL